MDTEKKLFQCIKLKGNTHAVRLLTWVDGGMLADCPFSLDLISESGEYLGKLNLALDDFKEYDGLVRTHLWDLVNFELVGNDIFVKALKNDTEKRKLLETTLSRFRKEVLPLAKVGKLRKGLTHGDFNDANIIIDKSKNKVCGVIDFGDSCMSWRVNDPAIALGYIAINIKKSKKTVNMGKKEISEAFIAFLSSYLRAYPLTEDELSVVLILAAGRMATSATMGWYSFSLDPSNLYLKYHAEPAWDALKAVLDIDLKTFVTSVKSKMSRQRTVTTK
eukprot:CAMPEP_0167740462 /NCGR_PEP_ID=MMETSP0110_2-20121227/291_1 /TAXON_ID=629695 /ORGANISM="Gymnochlora sp., Strain CCMP2014" /LENGTH=275 /DNA_ID=CAMNT_0007624359 /DNA_START=234 /DNA_END=1061 /DNA_ORIENTATION=+